MRSQLAIAFRLMLVLTVLTGLLYPGLVTGLCQLFFPRQANGSLVSRGGVVVGSSLLGQSFARPEYFHPRPSAAGEHGYDASASGGSNDGPASRELIERIRASVAQFRRENPDYREALPADLLTASASGLDPDVSPASAQAQAERVAKARGVPVEQIRRLIEHHTEKRQLGLLGEPRVNVLKLNLALDRQFPRK